MTVGASATALWPLLVYLVAVVIVVAGIIALSYVLGQRHRQRATGQAYESGLIPTGSARLRLSASFYLIAMLFVIFDLESVFIFAWAVDVRNLGWAGYVEVLIFTGVLLAALAYLWRVGALDWGSARRRRRRRGPSERSGQSVEWDRETGRPEDRRTVRP